MLRPSQNGERRLWPILTPSMTGLISQHTHIALGVSEPHSGCHIFFEVYVEGEDRFERPTYSYNVTCNNHMAAFYCMKLIRTKELDESDHGVERVCYVTWMMIIF